jgi:PKD repeat protein
MQGKGSVSSSGGAYSNDGIAIYYNVTNVTVSFVWMHGIGRCPVFLTDGAGNLLFEGFYVQSYFGSSSVHSEVMSSGGGTGATGDTTFRNSLVADSESTGGLMWNNAATPSSHFYVYGNVFYQPAGAVWTQANGLIGGWTGANGEQMYNVYVYNNTFVNVLYLPLGNFPQTYGGCMAKNNLFYNTVAPDFTCFSPHDYNQFVSSGTIQGESNGSTATVALNNYTNLDFTLTTNTPAGTNLGSPYNIDPLGNTRMTWSRGAYEYGSTSTNLAPPAPSGLLGVALSTTNSASLTIQASGSATNWASSLQYNFGDGSYTNFGNANYASAVHTYASTGTYTVTLTASNNVSGLSIPNSQIITITQ